MKKIFKFFIFLLFFLMLTSCSSNNSNDTNSQDDYEYTYWDTNGISTLLRKKERFVEKDRKREKIEEIFYKDRWILTSEKISIYNAYGQKEKESEKVFDPLTEKMTLLVTCDWEFYEIQDGQNSPNYKYKVEIIYRYNNEEITSGTKTTYNYNTNGQYVCYEYKWNTSTNTWEKA